MTSSRKVGNRFGYSKKETKENLDGGNKLEELLNKLIQKGWKPRGNDEWKKIVKDGDWYSLHRYVKHIALPSKDLRLRNLVSKESGLWQFVCENRMTKKMEKNPRGIWINSWSKSAYEKYPVYTMEKAEYRIIESTLCNEENLEKFLLDNIKVEGQQKN